MRGLYGHLLIPNKRALLFMEDFAAGEKPSKLKSLTGAPTRETVTVSGDGGTVDLDVYRPSQPTQAGLLLVPGVSPQGKNDPRMITFATTVARNGFGVVVPDLPSLSGLQVRADHYRNVVAGFRHLLSDPTLAPGRRAGIGGFSFAMGPGLLAALDDEIVDDVRFLFCIGGYHDILAVLRFVTTGTFRESARHPWRRLEPDHYGRWVTASSLSPYIAHEPSREAFKAIVDRRVPDAGADIADLVERLEDATARGLLELITNTDPARVDERFAALPAVMRENLLAMDLSNRDLSRLRARLILVHGYEDTLLPYTESLALYRRAPGGRKRLYLVNGLSHVTMGKPGVLDVWALLSSVTALLNEQRV